jgi:hypothetical protein
MVVTFMLRKSLAVVLISTWIHLSGADLIEDCDFPREVNLHSPGSEVSASLHSTNDIVESASLTKVSGSTIRELPDVSIHIDGSTVENTTSKIYKLLRVFLI